MGKYNAKKAEYDGYIFDSITEMEYYQELKFDPNVVDIEIQPQFTLIKRFGIVCTDCKGSRTEHSAKTGKLIKCKKCKGSGHKERQPWTYKADFQVVFKNGVVEVIDVKGFSNERFPLVKKMFEYTHGRELLVVKKTSKGWVKK